MFLRSLIFHRNTSLIKIGIQWNVKIRWSSLSYIELILILFWKFIFDFILEIPSVRWVIYGSNFMLMAFSDDYLRIWPGILKIYKKSQSNAKIWLANLSGVFLKKKVVVSENSPQLQTHSLKVYYYPFEQNVFTTTHLKFFRVSPARSKEGQG